MTGRGSNARGGFVGVLLAALLIVVPAGALARQDVPTRPCAPQTTVIVTGSAPPGAALLLRFQGRIVGGGSSGPDGVYRLPLVVGRERPGSYTVSVTLRAGGEELQRFTCEVPGGTTPTPAAVTTTPRATATPQRGPSSPLLPSPTPRPSPTATAVRPPLTRPASDFDRDGDGRVTCADFATQAAAREALAAGYVDLDEDRDGVPCENLPAGSP